jgi:two-component system response regulator YesN
MVVDDEDIVRHGIIKNVPWSENGFCVVGDAKNGEDALELSKDLQPDLVITDIKMPYMDGLELAASLKSVLPTVKVVIITGFDDFEYAKRAIGLHVAEFVLKPVNVGELTEILVKTRLVMEAEEISRRDYDSLKRHYDETLPMLREHLFTSLLEGRVTEERASVLFEKYGIGFYGDFSAVACVRFEHSSQVGDNQGDEAIFLVSVRRLIETKKAAAISFQTVIYADYIVVIANFSDRDGINGFIGILNEVCGMVEKYYGMSLSVGVGYIGSRCGSIDRSYAGALAALDYRVIIGTGHAVYIGDIEPDETLDISISSKDEQSLLGAMRLGNSETIVSVIDTLISRCAESRLPYQKYQAYLLEIFTFIIHILRLNKIDIESIFGGSFDIIKELSQSDSLPELKDKLASLCVKAAGHMSSERQNTSNMFIESSKKYAAENYRKPDFSVDGMCRELHVSPAYFSSIFKRTQNVSFVSYLTNLRLNEAARMLAETDLKTHSIANAIGFTDANYFSFVFKKRFGSSPSSYRSGLSEK